MEEGFRDRANEVMQLLAAPSTAFVLVTSPRRDAVEEAEFFAERLADGALAVDALVVNRVHPRYHGPPPDELAPVPRSSRDGTGSRDDDGATRLAAQYANLADFEERRDPRASASSAGSSSASVDAAIAHVPELGHDVHDFDALRAVAAYLV